MGLFIKFFNILNSIVPIADFVYLLQIEEYLNKRYIKDLSRFFFRRGFQKRDKLKWTPRALLTALGALLFFFAYIIFHVILLVLLLPNDQTAIILFSLLSLVLAVVLVPIFVLFSNILSLPRIYLENKWYKEATQIVEAHKGLRVIAVTGSFGKTTTKNFIFELTKYNYKAQLVPGNINTAIGIALWIKKHLESSTEILVVEMGAYIQGEIKRSCLIVPPDIAVITALGDQHLERFGSYKELVKTKLEIFEYSKTNSYKILPGEYEKEIQEAGYKGEVELVTMGERLGYLGELLSLNSDMGSLKPNLALALKVAEKLEIPLDFVKDTVKKLELPERRKQIISMYGFEVLDDSYNISYITGGEAVRNAREIANKKNKKLVVITAGIPELGSASREKNGKYGELLSREADNIVLLNSILAKEVVRGFDTATLDRTTRVSTMLEAWNSIREQFDPSDAFILMQPELTDSYY